MFTVYMYVLIVMNFSGPSEEEERLVEKVKTLQNELAKARKESESQKSIDGAWLWGTTSVVMHVM